MKKKTQVDDEEWLIPCRHSWFTSKSNDRFIIYTCKHCSKAVRFDWKTGGWTNE